MSVATIIYRRNALTNEGIRETNAKGTAVCMVWGDNQFLDEFPGLGARLATGPGCAGISPGESPRT